jgi:hypothetical protein
VAAAEVSGGGEQRLHFESGAIMRIILLWILGVPLTVLLALKLFGVL